MFLGGLAVVGLVLCVSLVLLLCRSSGDLVCSIIVLIIGVVIWACLGLAIVFGKGPEVLDALIIWLG
jgi:hypothetical protein